MLTNDSVNCAPLIGTNRKVFRLTLCAPEKTIANKHEGWILRAVEGVGISDSLDARSAFAPKPSAKWRHMPGVPRVTPSNIAVTPLSLNRLVPGPKKRPLSEPTQASDRGNSHDSTQITGIPDLGTVFVVIRKQACIRHRHQIYGCVRAIKGPYKGSTGN